MKKIFTVLLAASLLFVACSDKPKLTQAQIEFFKAMGEKIPYMKPDTTVVLARTSAFDIRNHDIMENVFQGMRGDITIISNVEPQRIESFIMQVVTLKAQQEVLLAEAEKEGIRITKDTVNAFIEKNLYTPNGGKEAFMEQLKIQQIDLNFVREDVRKNMLIMKYIDEVILSDLDIRVSDEEVGAYYEANKDQYQQETVSARHILFLTQGKNDQEKSVTRELAENVLERARSGEDFLLLVADYSEDPGSNTSGGLYEDFPRGRMVQAFEDASFNMKIGDISNLVETPYGYHIIKKEGHKYGFTLDEVRSEIENILVEQKKEAAFPAILDSLVEKYEYTFLL
ncbi:MAG: peptidylprolyl isomerase [Candidatus Neomarinimicrobiota bacterium]|jgi:foldase protein PrsA|nr:peptidylprolyl isomerase [Candidatus Neomarinimicrobiota bacterium]